MRNLARACKQAFWGAQIQRQRRRYTRASKRIDMFAGSANFEQMVERIRNSGTNSLTHFRNSYKLEGGLRLQQNPTEFAALCEYLRLHAAHGSYMEIGTASGGTCRFISEVVGFERTYILDDGNHPDAIYQDDNLRNVPNVTKYVGDSHSPEAAEFLRNHTSGPMDVILVDGDHSYAGAWMDVQLALTVSRPGTVMVLHDTVACEGVARTWLKALRERRLRPIAEFVGADAPLGIGVGEVS